MKLKNISMILLGSLGFIISLQVYAADSQEPDRYVPPPQSPKATAYENAIIIPSLVYVKAINQCIQDRNSNSGCNAGTNGIPPAITSPVGSIASLTVVDSKLTITPVSGNGFDASDVFIAFPTKQYNGAIIWAFSGAIIDKPYMPNDLDDKFDVDAPKPGAIKQTKSSSGLNVGDFYQGGVIFWLDPSQNYQHGLIADINDIPGRFSWSDGSTLTGANSKGAYSGKDNTKKILATPGAAYPAANACATNKAQGYSDWYLPSVFELEQMSDKRWPITSTAAAHNAKLNFGESVYWSSEEGGKESATYKDFRIGTGESINNKGTSLMVHCVRSF